MNGGLDQEGMSASVTDRKLADAARGRRAEPGRTAALKELLRRESPRARRVVCDVLVDRKAPLEMRTTAARALGKMPGAAAETSLLAALKTREGSLQARVAETLGRIGGRKAFDALGRVKSKSGTAQARTVRFARSLIAYRLGLDEARLRRPPKSKVLKLGRKRAARLKFERVSPNTFRAAAASVAEELPGIAIAQRGSVRFTCRHERLWLVLTAEVDGAGAAQRIADSPAVVAVLLKESHCPDAWYVYEYFLSHPRAAGKADLFGVRPTGELSHFGNIDMDDRDAAVHLQTVNTPRLQPAIELAAEYRGRSGSLTFTDANVAAALVRGQKSPLQPRPDGPRL